MARRAWSLHVPVAALLLVVPGSAGWGELPLASAGAARAQPATQTVDRPAADGRVVDRQVEGPIVHGVRAGDDDAATIGQVDAASRRDDGSLREAIPQLQAPVRDGEPTVRQVAAPDRVIPPALPAGQRDRATQSAVPLPRPSDGRRVATPRLAGEDRCDPQSATYAKDRACRSVLETRAESFAVERRDLSPEQRLIAERYGADDGRGILAEVRRVGRNDVDAGSTDAQALAAFLQAEQQRAQAAADAAADTAQKAEAAVAISVANGAK